VWTGIQHEETGADPGAVLVVSVEDDERLVAALVVMVGSAALGAWGGWALQGLVLAVVGGVVAGAIGLGVGFIFGSFFVMLWGFLVTLWEFFLGIFNIVLIAIGIIGSFIQLFRLAGVWRSLGSLVLALVVSGVIARRFGIGWWAGGTAAAIAAGLGVLVTWSNGEAAAYGAGCSGLLAVGIFAALRAKQGRE
jgi:hypothetical protein